MPQAFVVMPFAAEFNDVYEHVIRAPLAAEGFDVLRADEMQNSRSIMHDVVQGILGSDLVIADLTGRNANVFYELGIAHAVNKKVLLLAQDIEDVPFDLRAYRVITYSIHFARVAEAIAQIISAGRAALAGTLASGNPVSDFLNSVAPASQDKAPPETDGPTNPEATIELPSPLDIAADLQQGMSTVSSTMQQFQDQALALTPVLADISEKMQGTLKHDAIALRELARGFAHHLDSFSGWMRGANRTYSEGIGLMTQALDTMFASGLAAQEESLEQLPAVLTVIEGIEEKAIEARVSMVELADALDKSPRVEKEFNRAKRLFWEELRTLISGTEQVIAVMSRTKTATIQVLSAASAT
jgi:hypothetical protein